MVNLRRKVEALGQRFYCREHPDEPLLCSECDMMELSDEEWDELAVLLEQAGFFNREPLESQGVCWRCHDGILACLQCREARGEPPEMDLMDADAIDRLWELGAKLVPPWL
jgi:hypothetical protein